MDVTADRFTGWYKSIDVTRKDEVWQSKANIKKFKIGLHRNCQNYHKTNRLFFCTILCSTIAISRVYRWDILKGRPRHNRLPPHSGRVSRLSAGHIYTNLKFLKWTEKATGRVTSGPGVSNALARGASSSHWWGKTSVRGGSEGTLEVSSSAGTQPDALSFNSPYRPQGFVDTFELCWKISFCERAMRSTKLLLTDSLRLAGSFSTFFRLYCQPFINPLQGAR